MASTGKNKSGGIEKKVKKSDKMPSKPDKKKEVTQSGELIRLNDELNTLKLSYGSLKKQFEEKESSNSTARKNRLLSAFANATGCLLSITDLKSSVNESLKIIGEAVEVDRLYIFENHKDDKGRLLMSQTFEWCLNPLEAQIDNPDLQNFDYKNVPRWQSLMINGKSVYGLVKDFPESEREILEPQKIKSLLAIPIFVDNFFWGFIGFDDIKKERIWSEVEVDILKSLANILALYIEEKRTEEKYFNKAKELWILNQVIISANQSPDLNQIFKNVMDSILDLLDFDGGGIYIVNDSKKSAELIYHSGITKMYLDEIKSLDITREPYDRIFIEGVPIFTDNYHLLNSEASRNFSILSLASIPVRVEDKIIGAINVKSRKRKVVSDMQKNLLRSIADQLAGAVQRRQIFDHLIRNEQNLNTFFNTIEDMLFVLDGNGNIIKVNEAVTNKLKFSEKELIGQNVLTVHIPEGRSEAQRVVGEMLAGNLDVCSVPLVSKYGDVIKVETKVKLGQWNNEQVIFGISRDISQRIQMEKDLKLSEERWKYALEGNGDGLWDWDLKTNGVFLSRRWKEMLGYKEDELENSLATWESRVHPDDLKKAYEDIEKHLSGKTEFYQNEHRVKCKDGTYKWILDRGKIMEYDANGKPVRMVGTHVDITLRKQIEDSLKESESRNRAMLGLIPDMLFIMTPDGYYTDYHVPDELKQHVKPEAFIGKHLRDVLTADIAEKFLEFFKIAKKTKKTQVFEYCLEKNDERERAYYESRILTYGTENKILTIVRDITEKKRYEAAVQQSEKRYRFLAENSQDLICLHTLDNKYEFVSPSIKSILGYTEEEVLTKSPDDFMYEDDAKKITNLIDTNIFDKQPTYLFEARFTHKDGNLVWLEILLSAVRDEAGEIFKILSISRDITLRKKAEDDIRSAYEKEKSLNELKSVFISTTSHEFRTPLSSILSSAELLEFYSSAWPEERKKQHLQKIKTSVNNMTVMLNNILSFNKAETGRISFNRTRTNVKELCENMINDFKERTLNKFKTEFEYNAASSDYEIDSKLILQALNNLLENSTKFSKEGSAIKLTVADEKDKLVFEVFDEGMGIPDSDKEKLFSPFYRGSNVNLIQGTGIGLSLVKEIAEMHKGSITFRNNSPKGTVFKLEIKTKI